MSDCDKDITYGHNVCQLKTISGSKQSTNYNDLKNGYGEMVFSCRNIYPPFSSSSINEKINNQSIIIPEPPEESPQTVPTPFTPKPTIPPPEDKTVIVALEFLRGNYFIDKLTGVYYCNIYDVYNNDSLKCYTDTLIINPYKGIIPEYYVNYFDQDNPIGVSIKENYNNRILMKAPPGYALSGIATNSTGINQSSQLQLKFSPVFNKILPDKYCFFNQGIYTDIVNSEQLMSGNISRLYCGTDEFIQNLEFVYIPQLEKSSSGLATQILNDIVANIADNIKSGKICDMNNYSLRNHGFKGVSQAKTIKLDSQIYEWINKIDKMRMCDITGNDLYDKDTIEYIYSRYVSNLVIDQDGPYYRLPATSECNAVIDKYCTVDKLHDDICEKFCGLNHTDCDAKIFQYCNDEKFWNTTNIQFDDNKSLTLKTKKLSEYYGDSVCSCVIDTGNEEYSDKIKQYYINLLPKYTELLDNNPEDLKLKQKVSFIKNKIETVDSLYNVSKSLDKNLQNHMKLDSYQEIKDVRLPCSFSWCAKSNFKLKSQKNIQCNATEQCLGEGLTVPMTANNDASADCNMQEGIIDYLHCTNPLDPRYVIYPNFISESCRNIMDKTYETVSEDVASYCELSDFIDKECNYETKTIDNYTCKRGTMIKEKSVDIPEFPIGGEGLCPPPNSGPKLICLPRQQCSAPQQTNNSIYIYIIVIIILFIIIYFNRKYLYSFFY